MFNGEKLTELRLLYGLTRAQLAEKLELTEQAVWQFETNKTEPKLSPTQFSLARLFNVDLSYFDGENGQSYVKSGAIAFRNADITSKRTIKIQEAYLNKAHEIIKYLESFLISPDWNFFDLVNELNSQESESLDMEALASKARKMLAISEDNSDILYKLELSGINVMERLINGEADAYSLWTNDDVPYIILGTGKSAVRRNFDLAHELGHLLLHKGVEFDELDKYDYQRKEQEANLFASNFLLPKEQFLLDFASYVNPKKLSNPESYLGLKRLRNVSIQSLEMRAYKLGLLSPSENSYFYRLLNSKYKSYKTNEPLDNEIPQKRPTKVRSILDTIFSNGLISLQDLLKAQKIQLKFLVNVLKIDENFFEAYKETREDFSQVIRLEDYRKQG